MVAGLQLRTIAEITGDGDDGVGHVVAGLPERVSDGADRLLQAILEALLRAQQLVAASARESLARFGWLHVWLPISMPPMAISRS